MSRPEVSPQDDSRHYSLALSPDSIIRNRLSQLYSLLPTRRRGENIRKNTEEEIKAKLVEAFVRKLVADIEQSGHTVRRQTGSSMYVSEHANGVIFYISGNRSYEVILNLSQGTAGEPFPHISSRMIGILILDNVNLRELPEGESRIGQINKDIYFPAADDIDVSRHTEEGNGSGHYFKNVKHVTGGSAIVHLTFDEITEFLKELLVARVDDKATEDEFNRRSNRPKDDFVKLDIYWNKDRPGELTSFFASLNESAQSV